MGELCSRRSFVSLLPAIATAQIIGSEQKRLRDPATEFEILRHTDPKTNSWLTTPPGRAFSHKLGGLLYCSDRGGSVQAYRMDLKSGESKQLTEAEKLNPSTFTCLSDDKSLCFFDGSSLMLLNPRPHTVYTSEGEWQPGNELAIADDGGHAVFTEHREERRRLRIVALPKGGANTVLETGEQVTELRTRPKRPTVLYDSAGALWLIDYDGRNHRKLKTPAGETGPAYWSADGKSVVYLQYPQEKGKLHQLREYFPDSDEDRGIAPTSQFVQFARNADASIFAGVSGSKGSPYVLLLHRITRRELPIAEHRASDPRKVVVTFSPNSQRLFYHTDREGHYAIYSILLERFVEKTDT